LSDASHAYYGTQRHDHLWAAEHAGRHVWQDVLTSQDRMCSVVAESHLFPPET